MIISIIVAIAKNWAIGKDNKLLWHIPEDLKRFKKITAGHTVIMGQKTWESLPIRPLPHRTNIIISNDDDYLVSGAIVVHSIEESIIEANKYCDLEEEVFIIGGASIYEQFMPIANRLYVTHVNKSFDADTYFPTIYEENWKLISKEDDKNDEFEFSYCVYEKI